jgi:hypothetical protein
MRRLLSAIPILVLSAPASADPILGPIAILYFEPGSIEMRPESRRNLDGYVREYVRFFSDGYGDAIVCAGLEDGSAAAKRLAGTRSRLVARRLRDGGVRPVRRSRYRQCEGLGEMDKPSVLLLTGPGRKARTLRVPRSRGRQVGARTDT